MKIKRLQTFSYVIEKNFELAGYHELPIILTTNYTRLNTFFQSLSIDYHRSTTSRGLDSFALTVPDSDVKLYTNDKLNVAHP